MEIGEKPKLESVASPAVPSEAGKKRPYLKVLGGLVFIALLVALGYYVWQRASTPKVPPGLNAQQQALYLADQGDYKAAENVWQKKLDATTDTPGKLAVYYQQAMVAVKFKKYDDAKKYAANAMKLDSKSYIPYATYAEIAVAQGDKASARNYYQQTIEHVDPNLDAANIIKHDYEVKLEGVR